MSRLNHMSTAELTLILGRAEDATADLGFVRSEMYRHAKALASGKPVCEQREMARLLFEWTRQIDNALGVLRQDVGRPIASTLGLPWPPPAPRPPTLPRGAKPERG
jgi:hypothetical protein